MKIQRQRYLKEKEEHEEVGHKLKLQQVLAEMETAVAVKKQLAVGIDESAERIQRAARKMISRIRFRHSLYKMILFKSIVENKVHKEKMTILYAFEQLIINTEEL